MDYKTVSIPEELYDKIEEEIEDTGFRNVSEFIIYISRETISAGEGDVKEKLKSLGYLD